MWPVLTLSREWGQTIILIYILLEYEEVYTNPLLFTSHETFILLVQVAILANIHEGKVSHHLPWDCFIVVTASVSEVGKGAFPTFIFQLPIYPALEDCNSAE